MTTSRSGNSESVASGQETTAFSRGPLAWRVGLPDAFLSTLVVVPDLGNAMPDRTGLPSDVVHRESRAGRRKPARLPARCRVLRVRL